MRKLFANLYNFSYREKIHTQILSELETNARIAGPLEISEHDFYITRFERDNVLSSILVVVCTYSASGNAKAYI